MKGNWNMKVLVAIFLSGEFLFSPFYILTDDYITRRIRDFTFYELIQDLKTGIRSEIAEVFKDGEYEIHLWGKYLPPVSPTGEFSYPQAFVSVRVYKNGEKIGYFCVFPTSKGYRAVSSARKEGEGYVDLGELSVQLVRTMREIFKIEKDLGLEESRQQFNPQSFEQLPSYLAIYFYHRIASQKPDLSSLERFIFTVDGIKESIDVSPEKIAEILSHSQYGCGNFSHFGLYYRVVNQYSGGKDRFFSELREIKEKGMEDRISMKKIEKRMVEWVRKQCEYALPDEQIIGLLYAGELLKPQDSLH